MNLNGTVFIKIQKVCVTHFKECMLVQTLNFVIQFVNFVVPMFNFVAQIIIVLLITDC